MEVFGEEIKVLFCVKNGEVLAYGWHYTEEKASLHLTKIIEYHGIEGEIVKSRKFEKWLKGELIKVVLKGNKFVLPDFEYKNKRAYEKIIEIPKGKSSTYSNIARASNIKFTELLVALMRNPFQVLIPCHRLLTKHGSIMGFYPLGKEMKMKLLEIEGIAYERC